MAHEYIVEDFQFAGEDLKGYTVEKCPVCGESTAECADEDVWTYNCYNKYGRLSFVYHYECSKTEFKFKSITTLFKELEDQLERDLGGE